MVMPSWRIHTKYAVLMGIDGKIARAVNKAIDFRAGIHDAGLKSPIASLIPGTSPRDVPRFLTYSLIHGISLLIKTLGISKFLQNSLYQYAVALHYLLDEIDGIVKWYGSTALQNIDYEDKVGIINMALKRVEDKLHKPCEPRVLGGYVIGSPCNEAVIYVIGVIMNRAREIAQNNLDLLVEAVDEIIQENSRKGFEVGPVIIRDLLGCVCERIKRRGGKCLFTVNGRTLPMASAAERIANAARKGMIMISSPIVLTAGNIHELIEALQKYCNE